MLVQSGSSYRPKMPVEKPTTRIDDAVWNATEATLARACLKKWRFVNVHCGVPGARGLPRTRSLGATTVCSHVYRPPSLLTV